MSKRAEERALKAYPHFTAENMDDVIKARKFFAKGYEQAEKDNELTWEDMRRIIHIDEEMMDDPEAHPEWMEEKPFYEEMLRRFKEEKK